MKLKDTIRETNLQVKDYTPFDVDEQWKIFQDRVGMAPPVQTTKPVKTTKTVIFFSFSSMLKAAAVLAVVVSVYLIAKPAKKMASFTTLDNTETIKMVDESVIYLDSFSTVSYPIDLKKATARNLKLTGNAIFEVAHNPELPFIVECGDVRVEAVGTTFSMSQTDSIIEIEGIVGVVEVSDKGRTTTPIRLNPGEKLQYQSGQFDLILPVQDTVLEIQPEVEPNSVSSLKKEIVQETKPAPVPESPQPAQKKEEVRSTYKASDIIALLERRFPGKIKAARKIKSDNTTLIKVVADKDLDYLLNELTKQTPFKVKPGKCSDCFEIYLE